MNLVKIRGNSLSLRERSRLDQKLDVGAPTVPPDCLPAGALPLPAGRAGQPVLNIRIGAPRYNDIKGVVSLRLILKVIAYPKEDGLGYLAVWPMLQGYHAEGGYCRGCP